MCRRLKIFLKFSESLWNNTQLVLCPLGLSKLEY
jgi:hypothetical protein